MDGVGVGEEQPLPAGDFGSGGDGIVLAGPTGWEFGSLDQLYSFCRE